MELGGGTQGDQSVLQGPSPCVAWKSALVCFAHLCKGEEGAGSPSFPPPCRLVGVGRGQGFIEGDLQPVPSPPKGPWQTSHESVLKERQHMHTTYQAATQRPGNAPSLPDGTRPTTRESGAGPESHRTPLCQHQHHPKKFPEVLHYNTILLNNSLKKRREQPLKYLLN